METNTITLNVDPIRRRGWDLAIPNWPGFALG